MTKEELTRQMKCGFHKQVSDGVLDDTEIAAMGEHMIGNLDHDGEGQIGIDEFLVAASSDEAIGLEDLAKLYDGHRKVGISEKLLGGLHGKTGAAVHPA